MSKKEKKTENAFISMRTDKELKEIAKDVVENKIFTDWHIREFEFKATAPMVFMPLMFLEKEQVEGMKDAGMVYEYYDKAGPRSINGYPIFMSMRVLHKDQSELLKKYMDKYEQLQTFFLESEVPVEGKEEVK